MLYINTLTCQHNMPKAKGGLARANAREESTRDSTKLYVDSSTLEVYRDGKIVGYVDDDNEIVLFLREERGKRKSF